MSVSPQSDSSSPALNRTDGRICAIFCAVIDNFGDIGVCWRLARQLVREHGLTVRLFVDDWATLLSFLDRPDAACLPCLQAQGVDVRHWRDAVDWPVAIAGSALVIEAFGCALPDAVITEMAKQGLQKEPPGWINLEYLSAESWVEGYHGRSSLQTLAASQRLPDRAVLDKTFFFPGFTAATGGLLREHDLLAQHQCWQADLPKHRHALLRDAGIDLCRQVPGWHHDALLVSLFAYPGQAGGVALTSWFAAMAEAAEPTLCLVPAGQVLGGVADAMGQARIPMAGDVLRQGNLSVAVIPFLPLDDYDRLLSVCDLNVVRGEDSFVRAQWAARPLVWHIYPQQEDAHRVKLDAFLARYSEDKWCARHGDKLARFNRFWNLDADCRKLWHDLRPQLPDLTHRARNWQQKLAELPDLASSLMQFYRNRP